MAPCSSSQCELSACSLIEADTLAGIARMSAQDDLYDGYSIPEGTVVIPNIWSIPSFYSAMCKSDSACARGIANDCPRATEFDPERFLNEGAPVDPSSWAFGFGKRCPSSRRFPSCGTR